MIEGQPLRLPHKDGEPPRRQVTTRLGDKLPHIGCPGEGHQLAAGSKVQLYYGYENCCLYSGRRLQRGRAPGSQNQKIPQSPFSDALREYLARHTPDSVTEAMNKACSELGAAKDEFVSSAARRVLERSEW